MQNKANLVDANRYRVKSLTCLRAIGLANQSQFSGKLARGLAVGRDHGRDGMSHRGTRMDTDRGRPGETSHRSLLAPAPARARRRIILLSDLVFILTGEARKLGLTKQTQLGLTK